MMWEYLFLVYLSTTGIFKYIYFSMVLTSISWDCGFPSSCESSWKKATELLFDVASRGEATGYGFPCLVIAAKDDLDQYPNQVQDSARV